MATTETLSSAARSELRGITGELIGPEDSGYDEARRVHNGDDRPPSGRHPPRARRPTTSRPGSASPAATTCRSRSAAAGTAAPASAPSTTASSSTSRRCRRSRSTPTARTVAAGGGAHPDPGRRRDGRGRHGDAARHPRHDRRRRADARRRHRPPGPQHGLTIDNLLGADVVLADGSKVTGQRRREPRPVLGAPRRRRQLRRRDRVPLPAAPGEHGHRRPDVLVARRHRGGHAALPGVHPAGAAGAERLLRVRDRPAGGAVPPRSFTAAR